MALLRALGRCWLLAATVAPPCAAALALLAWFGMPPAKDTVRALLYVSSAKPKVLNPDGEPSGGAFVTYQRTQLALLKSRLVLNAALRQPGVAGLGMVEQQADPIQWLEKEIKADFTSGAEILRVSMPTDRPDEAKVLVNAVTKAYLEEIVNKDHHKRLDQLEKLKVISGKYEDTLRRRKTALKQTAETVGSTDGPTLALKQRFAQEQLAQAQKELLQAQSDLRRLHIEIATQAGGGDGWRGAAAGLWAGGAGQSLAGLPWAALAATGAGDVADEGYAEPALVEALLDQQMATDPAAQKHLTRRAQAEDAVAQARRISLRGEQDETVRRARQDLDAANKAVEERRQELRPGVEKQLRDRNRADRRVVVAQMQRRATVLSALEKVLSAEVKRLGEDSQAIGRGAISIESYKQEIAQVEEMARQLATQVEVLTVELDAPSRVTPLEEAVVVSADNKQRRLVATAGAGGGTLFVVLFLIAWRDHRARRINSVEEVSEGLRLNVVGTVPVFPAARPAWLGWAGAAESEDEWRTRLAESVDATRTMILHAATKIPLQIVMVTSAVGGEGKTSLSGHLAASLARAGRRTLLIDCDLRNPAAHRLFDVPSRPGLSELLRGETSPDQAVVVTHTAGLSLLPAGLADARVLQALAQDDLRLLFQQLRREYEFIVVDSCPVLPVTDSLLVGRHVDAVVFSVLHGVSKMPLVQAASERLAMLDIPMLGAVVCGTRETARRYTYRPPAAPQPAPEEETPSCESTPR